MVVEANLIPEFGTAYETPIYRDMACLPIGRV